ncbi:GNAT family N-acetyltransferase [Antarctobacter heliothermus]|uniref:Protein N-acetyltransferase, RimJ/RimL family n=1 Tax=Antarctobacter heliothermus TaxID=74033 RepID=A0A239E296_9RHOB|nr:GNAT family N-acetyltransferase [Antarctobacter heliothermus]SNS38865.1 Protein N-acetyltransferase, RimJ/RimL family [Antarctobacter heliothermus]
MTAFTTARLTIFPWEPVLDDAEARHLLETRLHTLLTPAVLEHLPPGFGPETGPQGMTNWISTRREKAQVSLINRDSDLIGLLFLFSPEGDNQCHLGYLLRADSWGQGYASELVQGLTTHLQHGPPQSLHAGVATDNPASARVLLKAGFKEDTSVAKDGIRSFRYATNNDARSEP